MIFKIGDRVKFVNNPYHYSIGGSNPIVGSKWECPGTVCGVGDYTAVNWDNGSYNDYKDGCLELLRNPVKVFLNEDLFEL